jgi:hypothetical protein
LTSAGFTDSVDSSEPTIPSGGQKIRGPISFTNSASQTSVKFAVRLTHLRRPSTTLLIYFSVNIATSNWNNFIKLEAGVNRYFSFLQIYFVRNRFPLKLKLAKNVATQYEKPKLPQWISKKSYSQVLHRDLVYGRGEPAREVTPQLWPEGILATELFSGRRRRCTPWRPEKEPKPRSSVQAVQRELRHWRPRRNRERRHPSGQL